MEKAAQMKDARLQACIATLIGWGDDDRAQLETFCAIALEVMGMCSPSKLREATLRIELKYYMREAERNGTEKKLLEMTRCRATNAVRERSHGARVLGL